MWGRGSPSSYARRHTCSSTTRGRHSRRAAMPGSSPCCRICAIAACADSTRSSSVTAISIIAAERIACSPACRSRTFWRGRRWGTFPARTRLADAGNAGPGTAWSSSCCIRVHSARASDNDSSCVLLVRSGAGSVLLAGDVEAIAESEIVDGGLVAHDRRRRASSRQPYVLERAVRGRGASCARTRIGRISQSVGVAAA